MTIHSKLAVAPGPERKRRVRRVDAVLVLGVAIGIGAMPGLAPSTMGRAANAK